ncbi:transferase [Syncephalis fuscata]|nr:transferase [Syncephalis fuscata]
MTIGDTTKVWLTPNGDKVQTTYQLSHADYITAPVYPQRFFFYKNHQKKANFMTSEILITGLRQTLEQYPIVAGRLIRRNDGEYEVKASDKGVPFTETYSDSDISEFEPNWPYRILSPEWQAITQPASEDLPLFAVRITRFANNSGLVMCTACNHSIADGTGWSMMLKTWTALVKGDTFTLPVHNRQLLRFPLTFDLFSNEKRTTDDTPSAAATSLSLKQCIILQFSPDKLEQLKSDAIATLDNTDQKTGWISTFDAIMALLWRTSVRARQVPQDKPIKLLTAINMRPSLPDVPDNYFGNAFNTSIFSMVAGDVMNGSLGSVAMANRQSVNKSKAATVQEWLARASVDRNKSLAEAASGWLRDNDTNSTNWSKCGYYAVDFGDGPPICLRRSMYSGMRNITLFDTPPFPETGKRGIEVCINIEEDFYKRYITDRDLLTYARVLE